MDHEISIEDIQTIKLMVCTPMYGGQCSGSYTKMMVEWSKWAGMHDIELHTHFIFNESIVSRARNDCAHAFLQSDCTHMLFIDADICADYLDLMRLVFLTTPDKIVGAPCSKKILDMERLKKAIGANVPNDQLMETCGSFNFNLLPDHKEITLNDLTEVAHVGTGIMCIHRETFQKFKQYYPQYAYEEKGENKHLFFDVALDDGSLVSEDILFCRRARRAGLSIYITPWIATSHWGTQEFRGNLVAASQVFRQ